MQGILTVAERRSLSMTIKNANFSFNSVILRENRCSTVRIPFMERIIILFL